MYKIVLSFLLLWSSLVFGQKTTVIKDSDTGESLSYTNVVLLSVPDSSFIKGIQANQSGTITWKQLPAFPFLIKISFLGYEDYWAKIDEEDQIPKVFTLKKRALKLNDIEILGDKSAISLKKDTLEFNGSSFNVPPNAMAEELLKKLPGVQVGADGTVKAQGENVTRITIDGKPFFGDDPKLATKNIPADAIDKVQIFDRKSDQATFSGFDDGNTEKSINFQLKPGHKKGKFGRVEAGYGTNERHASSFTYFDFRGAQQIAVLGSLNNINQSGFSSEDAMQFVNSSGGGQGGGGMRSMMNGGGGGSSFFGGDAFSLLSGQNTGINTTGNTGINYRDSWGKKLEVVGSYLLGYSDAYNVNDVARESILPNNVFNSLRNSTTDNIALTHRVNTSFDYKINGRNSLKIEPTLSFTENDNSSLSLTTTSRGDAMVSNKGFARALSNTDNWRFRSNILFRHKFAAEGRTLSVNANPRLSGSNGTESNQSTFSLIPNDQTATIVDSIDQRISNVSDGNGWSANVSYTEPLSKKFNLESAYNYSTDESVRTRDAFDFNAITGEFDTPNTELTNAFENVYGTHRISENLQFKKLKYTITLNNTFQIASLNSTSRTDGSSFKRDFYNYLPGFLAQITLPKGKTMRINYRTSTRQPDISDIQPVPDLSDPLRIRVGNPNLGQEFTHNLSSNLRAFDMGKNRFFMINARGEYNQNRIVNSTEINSFGIEETKKVNANGVWNANVFGTIGFPFRKFNINTNVWSNYRRDISFINGAENKGDVISYNIDLRATWQITEKAELTFGGSAGTTNTSYSLQEVLNNRINNLNGEISTLIRLPWRFRINSELTISQRTGLADGFNRVFTLWNGAITRTFLPKDRLEVSLSGFDLLNQNVYINRTTTSSAIEDTNALTIRNYFMLTGRYFLNKQETKMPPGMKNMGRMFRGGM